MRTAAFVISPAWRHLRHSRSSPTSSTRASWRARRSLTWRVRLRRSRRAQVEPAWIGYAVPVLNNDSAGRNDGWSERCRLEQQRVDPATNAPVPGPFASSPHQRDGARAGAGRRDSTRALALGRLPGRCRRPAGLLARRRERRAERRVSEDARDRRRRARSIRERVVCDRASIATRRRRPRFSISRRTARRGCASARSSGSRGAQSRRPPASSRRRSTTIPMSK